MEVILKKKWKNHPAGTMLKSVSPGVMKDLKALGVLDVERKRPSRKTEEMVKSTTSPVNKMISESPKEKGEGDNPPSTSKEKVNVKSHFQKKI